MHSSYVGLIAGFLPDTKSIMPFLSVTNTLNITALLSGVTVPMVLAGIANLLRSARPSSDYTHPINLGNLSSPSLSFTNASISFSIRLIHVYGRCAVNEHHPD